MYETSQLDEAYFLTAKNWPIRAVRREGKFCVFSFDAEAKEAVRAYWENEPVPVQTLLTAIRVVRGRMKTV